jgi:hypothetical protein
VIVIFTIIIIKSSLRNIAYIYTVNIFILISFLLGVFHTELFSLMSSILKHPQIMYTSSTHYFNFFSNIFSFLFKYIFYLYLIYTLYNFLNFYIHFDDTFLNNMAILSFDDLVNLSTNEYKIINNNTTNVNSYNVDKIIEHVPRAIATYGEYKAGMSVAKNVPNIGTKALVIASIGALSAGSITFGSIIDEELANRVFKNKNNFIQIFNNSNNIKLEFFPYN